MMAFKRCRAIWALFAVVATTSGSASAHDVDQVARTCISALESSDPAEPGIPRLPAACGSLFSDRGFVRGWEAASHVQPADRAGFLAEAARESYCVARTADRPAACTEPAGRLTQAVPAEARRAWRSLLGWILRLELGAERAPGVMSAFDRSWTRLFPEGSEVKKSDDVAGDPLVLGTLSKEQVRQVIRRHWADIRGCYDAELAKAPSLQGKVSVKFVIGSDGSVQSAEVASSSLGNPRAEDCIVARLRPLEFPKPASGGIVIVTYPFAFARP